VGCIIVYLQIKGFSGEKVIPALAFALVYAYINGALGWLALPEFLNTGLRQKGELI
jgi:hypothetical protein